jgi:hypothetical protein
MSEFLKGNFKLESKKGASTPQDAERDTKESLEKEFERRALEKLGGSIAFVVKPSLVWKGDKKDGKSD